MGQYASWFGMGDYENVDVNDLDDVPLEQRDYDCVMVFLNGDEDKTWTPPSDNHHEQFNYLQKLDTHLLDKREKLLEKVNDETSPLTQAKYYENERKLVMKALKKVNLDYDEIEEMNLDDEKDMEANEVPRGEYTFYFVGVSEERAREIAADKNINYELELDPQAAITYLNLLNEPLAAGTLDDQDAAENVSEDIWNNVYVSYVAEMSEKLYKSHEILRKKDKEQGYTESIFRIIDRISLINDIVSNDIEEDGAGIHYASLEAQEHPLVDFFPLHTPEQLDVIVDEFFKCGKMVVLPLEEMREYFGEYIAIYFAFLEFYIKFSLPIAILGIGFGTYQLIKGRIIVEGIQYFAVIVIAWAILFPMYWKRQEFACALRWGTLRFDLREKTRPEYQGDYRYSHIDGSIEEYFAPEKRMKRQFCSVATVIGFLLALLASTAGIVLLRLVVTTQDITYGSEIVSVANSLVIMFFNVVYGMIAEKMNEWENYRTETDYENSLIMKVFLFRFVNSYATLYYDAFIRKLDTNKDINCDAEKCMVDLREQVAIIFGTQIFVSNAIELGSVYATKLLGGGGLQVGFTNDGPLKDRITAEWKSEKYERTFDDYNELIIYFGYCTLFIVSFPFAAICGFFACILEARIDGYKICRLTRRPFPKQADDIGSWQFALEFMAWAVMITNLGLLCFITDLFEVDFGSNDDAFDETLTILLIFFILAIVWKCGYYCVGSTPTEIERHIARMNHLESFMNEVGRDIKLFLNNNLTDEQLQSYRDWDERQVMFYLQQVLIRHVEKRSDIAKLFKDRHIDGKRFNEIAKRFNTHTDHLNGSQLLLKWTANHRVALSDQEAVFVAHAAWALRMHAKRAKLAAEAFKEIEENKDDEDDEKNNKLKKEEEEKKSKNTTI